MPGAFFVVETGDWNRDKNGSRLAQEGPVDLSVLDPVQRPRVELFCPAGVVPRQSFDREVTEEVFRPSIGNGDVQMERTLRWPGLYPPSLYSSSHPSARPKRQRDRGCRSFEVYVQSLSWSPPTGPCENRWSF